MDEYKLLDDLPEDGAWCAWVTRRCVTCGGWPCDGSAARKNQRNCKVCGGVGWLQKQIRLDDLMGTPSPLTTDNRDTQVWTTDTEASHGT